MMAASYLEVNVVGIGSDAELMFEEKIMILFNNTVPNELKEIAIVHDVQSWSEEVIVGDKMVIDGEVFNVLFVGDKANETLRDLGHATFNFDGAADSKLPGTICLEAKPIPRVTPSTVISFKR